MNRPTAAPGPVMGRRPWLRALVVLLVLLFFVLPASIALFAWWLAGTDSGARTVAEQVEKYLPAVKLRGVEGRVTGPLRIAEVTIETATKRIVLNDVDVDWEPRAAFSRHLHIHRLHAANLTVEDKAVESPPLELPKDLRLPLTIAIDSIKLDKAAIPPVQLSNVGGSAAYDGTHYKVDLAQLALQTAGATPLSGDFRGNATLEATSPFALNADITTDTKGRLDDRAFGAGGTVKLAGSLEELKASIDLTLREAKASARAQGTATVKPYDPSPLKSAALKLQGIDLAALRADLPKTRLDADIDLQRLDAGTVSIVNREPGRYDLQRLPVRTLRAQVDRSGGGFRFSQLVAALGGEDAAGQVAGSGSYVGGKLTLDLTTRDLDLRKIDGRARATSLSGRALVTHVGGKQEFTLALTEPLRQKRLSIDAHGILADAAITIDRAELSLGQASVAAKAKIALSGTQAFSAEGRVKQFRLQDFGNFAKAPALLLNADFTASGSRSPALAVDVAFGIHDSQLAGHPLSGEGKVELRGNSLNVPRLALASGANRVTMQGALSERDSQLAFSIIAPQLEQIGQGYSGSLEATGTARGTMQQPRVVVEWKASALRLPDGIRVDASTGRADVMVDTKQPLYFTQAIAQASVRGLQTAALRAGTIEGKLQISPRPDAPLLVDIDARSVDGGGRKLDNVKLALNGTALRHVIDLAAAERDQRITARASGGVDDMLKPTKWQGTLERFEGAGTFDAKLTGDAAISLSRQRIDVEHLRVTANGALIDVERFVRDPEKMASKGRVEKLEVAKVLALAGSKLPLETDLVVDGQWDLTVGQGWAGTLTVDRRAGDVKVSAGTANANANANANVVALGLKTLHADVAAANGRLKLRVLADGQQLGHVELDADTATPPRGGFAIPTTAAVTGRAKIDVPNIAWIGPLVSPNFSVAGSLNGDVTLAGTIGEPALNGKLGGANLRVAMADAGIDLREGVLEGEFSGTRLALKRLEFASGNGGSVKVAGPIDFTGGKPSLQLTLNATRYQLLNRSDRKLVISGESRVELVDKRLRVTGGIGIDSGYFDIGRTGAPSLSDDVVIVGRETKNEAQMAMALDVVVKLGDGIVLTGRGLNATLQGEIRLLNEAGTPLRAQGTLNVARGTYTAYGQELAIEQGLLRFTGPLNNPALQILAMRRDRTQAVEAGVSVRGTVLVPRVTLVSEPQVPDAEKLAWLVLGRSLSTAGTGDMDALQKAAALLLTNSAANGVSSQIATAFGVDSISVGTSKDTVQQRIITVGKKISSRLYVSYQKGLETASNALLLRYTLSPRLTLEAETGTRSVLSIFYNIAFD